MDKRERLEKCIAGESVDRLPAALWRHWPGDDQRAADLAQAHLQFQQRYDWDFVVVVPASNFSVTGYGLTDRWQGATTGKRDILKRPVQRSLDWTDLRPLDPDRGDVGKQLACLHLLAESFQDTPFLQMVYSPLAQAARLAGQNLLFTHLRTHPDRLRSGLNVLTESTLRFVDRLRRSTAIAGILYVVEQASYNLLSPDEVVQFGAAYDRKVLENLAPGWWLNGLQVRGKAPMLSAVADYPVQFLNWSDVEGHPPLERTHLDFAGAYCGGLGENTHLNLGTPASIRDAARHVMHGMAYRKMILASGATVPVTSPQSNLRAARDAVELR